MALRINEDVQPGKLVYRGFKPNNPGIIRRIVSDETVTRSLPPYPDHTYRVVKVEVEWLKPKKGRPKTEILTVGALSDFESLIEDHRRKYENQTKLADKLRAM